MKTKIFILLGLLFFAISCKKDKPAIDLNSGLISHFNFDDNLKDQQGYANDGVVSGNPNFVLGKVGNALSLNGIDQKVVFSPKTPQASTHITVACWVKTSENSFNPKRFIYNPEFSLLTFKGNTAIFSVIGASSSGSYISGEWVHVIGIHDMDGIRMYINGASILGPNTDNNISGFINDIVLGNYNSDYWAGSIDEPYIYDRALSPEEVTQLYNLK